MINMNDSKLSAQGFGFSEQLRVVGDMNDSGFHDHKPLDVMNNSGLCIT